MISKVAALHFKFDRGSGRVFRHIRSDLTAIPRYTRICALITPVRLVEWWQQGSYKVTFIRIRPRFQS